MSTSSPYAGAHLLHARRSLKLSRRALARALDLPPTAIRTAETLKADEPLPKELDDWVRTVRNVTTWLTASGARVNLHVSMNLSFSIRRKPFKVSNLRLKVIARPEEGFLATIDKV